MRLLLTIPHYFNPSSTGQSADGREHGSVAKDPQPRIDALSTCIVSAHQLFNQAQCLLDHEVKAARTLTQKHPYQLDIVICTTRGKHLLADLPIPKQFFSDHATEGEPMLLGYDCHTVLHDRLGSYDYYGYLEDDLILHDPWFFHKLSWFCKWAGDDKLLQPNRYEVGPHHLLQKAYLDGRLALRCTEKYQNIQDSPELTADILGVNVRFNRTPNPHSGCFFLNARQMEHWVKQPYFLDREWGFIGPLESAASLGIQRAFKVYKPAFENADFLEIQHYGKEYLSMICREDGSDKASSERETASQR